VLTPPTRWILRLGPFVKPKRRILYATGNIYVYSGVYLPDIVRIDRLKFFLDSMGGGAWPFLVGGVICLVNSVNERDLDLLNSSA
jgi:hypothetical protein